MADRSSAAAFRGVFKLLAKDPTPAARKLAREVNRLTAEFDFTPDQMNCTDALFALGLAKRDVHPDYPADGETTLYLDADGDWS